MTHATLDLELDFGRREARGSVVLTLERRDLSAPLVVDVKGLVIESVRAPAAVGTDANEGAPRAYELGPADPNLGSPLTVRLEPGDAAVAIRYRTTADSEAMQWLEPEQTAGGVHPFLFTQGQSIFTRTWIPLQDSPSVRIAFEARIRAPEPLTPLMGAERLGRDTGGAYRFRMRHPIPPYLIALACGELAFEPLSPRCGVWAEPPVVRAAREEFADTEAMMAAVERLFGPYRWDRYELLVLPPSFPFGGMENPMLTFATPSVLTGDRSLVSLIAHELAHSWSGNLVTNATWSDFWLNEGFTVYLENRIMEELYGADRAAMEAELERAALEREMKELAARDQVLHVDLTGRHPDDGFTPVPYVKGALLLRRIEEGVGREAFDRFLTGYFDANAFRSITTEQFIEMLTAELLSRNPAFAASLNLHRWLEEPGLPGDADRPRSRALADVDRALREMGGRFVPPEGSTDGWVTQQWVHFLTHLPNDLTAAGMGALDAEFGFTRSKNSEIVCEWLRLAIEHGYAPAEGRLEEFLLATGRRKYLKPLYSDLAKTEEGKARARAIYARARPRYHPICRSLVDKILE